MPLRFASLNFGSLSSRLHCVAVPLGLSRFTRDLPGSSCRKEEASFYLCLPMSEEKNRYENILDAIEHERAHEEAYYKSLSTQKTIKERIESGICWAPCDVIKSYYTIGEHAEVQFLRRLRKTDRHKFKTGAGCIAYAQGKEEEVYKGIISFIRRDKISIIFSKDAILRDHDLLHGGVIIELSYDERSYKVMRAAIHSLLKTDDPHIVNLREGISNKSNFQEILRNRKIPDLAQLPINSIQQASLKTAVQAETISIIHGPPGTGKTTTLVQLVRILLRFEKRLLVCAPSNNATDLLAREIAKHNIDVVRVGNVSRMGDETAHLSLANKAADSEEWKNIKKVKIAAEDAFKKAKKFKRNFGEQERRERKFMLNEARDLKKWAKELENKLLDSILSKSQVICTTLISAANREISNINFDTLIIDEASQALEAECWNAIMKAKRVVLAGDHFQLPPTIMSKRAKEIGFEETLLDRMSDVIAHSTLLKTQYRMNDAILSFSNSQFYDSKLESADNVASRLLYESDSPITFIDTSGAGFEEALHEETLSKWNEGEYFILREHFMQHKEHYDGRSIGIISPYSAQVKFLTSNIGTDEVFREFDIEVNSIDGFQGQEKDVIYISLVRSNDNGEIGFLADYRRLNVAMTRARMKLVIIGDSATVSQNKLFLDLVNHIEKQGKYESAYQYMTY